MSYKKATFRQNNKLLFIGVTCLHGGRLSNMYDGGPALLDIREWDAHFFRKTKDENISLEKQKMKTFL